VRFSDQPPATVVFIAHTQLHDGAAPVTQFVIHTGCEDIIGDKIAVIIDPLFGHDKK